MTYLGLKFEVARSNSLGGDIFTRNVTGARTDGRRTNFGTKLIYPFFLKKKAGITLCYGTMARIDFCRTEFTSSNA